METEISVDIASESDQIADYLHHYGLSYDPFVKNNQGLAEDAGLSFYGGAQRQQLLDQLLYQCQFGSSALVVLGAAGVGKTYLLKVLQQKLTQQGAVCVFDIPPSTSTAHVLLQLAQGLGMPVPADASTGQLLSEIRHFIQRGEGEALALIDNVHNVDDQTLAALLSLLQGQDAGSRSLHLLLFAEPELVNRLDAVAVDDVLIHDLYMELLSPSDLSEYLHMQLSAAGFVGGTPFTADVVEHFWAEAQGNLSRVNMLAHQHLLAKAVLPEPKRGMGLPIEHMAAIVVLAAVLLLALFFQEDGAELDKKPATAELSTPLRSQPQPPAVQLVAEPQRAISKEPQRSVSKEPQRSVLTEPQGSISAEPQRLVLTEPQDSAELVQESNVVAASVTPTESNPLARKVGRVESSESMAAETIKPELDSALVSVAPPVKLKVVVSQPEPRAVAATELSPDEQTLLSLNPSHFTLQVLGAGSLQGVKDFMSSQSNRQALRLFVTRRSGKDWYVVVVGDYRDSDAARRAIATLPSVQRKAGPWSRSLLSVQGEIRRHHSL